jgi:hypothetical protein
VPVPDLTDTGDLPLGIHPAGLSEVLDRFGVGSAQRVAVASRLERIHRIVVASGHLARFVIFGSFITDKPMPNDVDIFLLMEDSFDASSLVGEAALLFDHAAAQAHFGASIFWIRKLAAMDGEQATIEHWQIKRGGSRRGIVEIIEDSP